MVRLSAPLKDSSKHRGFTLIELVMVIIVLGLVSVSIGGFIRTGLGIYNDVTERDQLLSESRFVVQRLNRELRMAVPNSVRVIGNTATQSQCLEFVPAEWVSYYTQLPVTPDALTTVNIVEIAGNTAGFVLDSDGITPHHYALVYPNSAAAVYGVSGNRQQITACVDGGANTDCASDDDPDNLAKLSVAATFDDASPASRLYIVGRTVSYCAIGKRIVRNEGGIQAAQTLYTGGVLMAENLSNVMTDSGQWPFQVASPSLTRNGLVNMRLSFERNEEIIHFSHEVHIPNVP
jgi:MSHA biogenesis protein MshO